MMRTTLDLPDSLLRELKARAAMNGQSLKALLNDLIQRAMRMPANTELAQAALSGPPVLKRLQNTTPVNTQTAADLSDNELGEDLEKLRRIGFIK